MEETQENTDTQATENAPPKKPAKKKATKKKAAKKTTKAQRKPKAIVAKGKIWVTKQFKTSGKVGEEEHFEEKLEVRCFDVEPAYVKAGYGLTINTGNFNSARCDVGVTLPCYVEEVPEAFREAFEICEENIKEQTSKIKRA